MTNTISMIINKTKVIIELSLHGWTLSAAELAQPCPAFQQRVDMFDQPFLWEKAFGHTESLNKTISIEPALAGSAKILRYFPWTRIS